MKVPWHRYWDLLAQHITPQKGRFVALCALLLTAIGLQVANPQIMRRFVDAAVAGRDMQMLAMSALAFILLAILQQALGVGASYLGENVAWTATNALRAELARHCLELDMGFHNNSSPGELIERIDGDVSELANFFSQLVIRVVGNLLLMLGVLVALAIEDWRLGLAFAGFATLALLLLNRVKDVAIAPQKALRAANADLFGFLEERLAGTEDIRSCGAVEFCIRGLYRLQAVILTHWRRCSQLGLLVQWGGGMVMMLGQAMAFVGGFYFYRAGIISVGTAYLVLYYVNILGRPIHELTHHVESLLFRLYDPITGGVHLGGVDIRQAKVRALRERVALVTQDVQLFQASVRDNLTFFQPAIPDEAIIRVLDELELGEWYRSLPNGLDTGLEAGGQGLSAGEAQLLALARVFLRDPGLVILDEASSRLDPLTERRIERAINKLLQGRTAIIIAHRLGTVQRADDILILERGRSVEQGERARLMADPDSRFSHLLQTGLEEVLA